MITVQKTAQATQKTIIRGTNQISTSALTPPKIRTEATPTQIAEKSAAVKIYIGANFNINAFFIFTTIPFIRRSKCFFGQGDRSV